MKTVLSCVIPEFIYSGQEFSITYFWNCDEFKKDYKVFVHFVEITTGITRFQNDHFPPVPTSQWTGILQYSKNVTCPELRPNGKYKVLIGLYEPGAARIQLDCGPGVTPESSYRYKIGEFYLSGKEVNDFNPIYEISPGADVQAALNQVASGGTLIFKPGSYEHASELKLENAQHVCLKGHGAELIASVPKNQALWIKDSHDVLIRGFIHSSPNRTLRLQNQLSCAMLVSNSHEISIIETHVKSSACAGIQINSESYEFHVYESMIENTFADGIHVTAKCHNGAIVSNTFRDTGDDCIGLIGYEKNGGRINNITIENNTIVNNKHGRGVGIEGAEDVVVTNNMITSSASAGIIIGSNLTYQTYGNKDITVSNNKFYNCNWDTNVSHGCIFINGHEGQSPGCISYMNENISISENQIEETLMGSAHVRVSAFNKSITVTDNVIIDIDGSKKAISVSSDLVTAGEITLSGNTYNGNTI